MTIFEAVKSTVTPRMAAEHFGLSVSRNGMVCCPFHNDRHPSMKLNEDYFYCFGCGAKGDVIEFTSKLFGITAMEAVQKLRADFGVQEDKPSILTKLNLYRTQADNERLCFRVLREYLQILQDWKVRFSPQTPEDDPDDRFVEACHMLECTQYAPNLPVHEDRLHVANGTLFLNGEFTDHKEFCRNRLPVKYDPEAPQPVTWLHFLSELLEDEDILTLQEYLGYCLIPTNRGQTMMLLKGNGGEGKSRIGVVMQKMLGDNLKNGSIAKVERSPFARADLEHQLLMVDDDMKMEALKSTHYLKSLITAEMPMDLERKGEQSYQGRCMSGFWPFPTAIWNPYTTTRTASTGDS